ncbi:RNA-directed DNA polymerase, eukaryota, reverse transcriptase zinc-binding domain protein, partial [Tanacetum coccineum]
EAFKLDLEESPPEATDERCKMVHLGNMDGNDIDAQRRVRGKCTEKQCPYMTMARRDVIKGCSWFILDDACNVDEMNKILRDKFVDLYQTPVLENNGVIKGIHGNDGNLGRKVSNQHPSLWLDIIKEVNLLRNRGIDLMSFLQRKMGNGEESLFWNDKWRGDNTLKVSFPRVYLLETQKHITVAHKLSHSELSSSFRRMPRSGIEEAQYKHLIESVQGVSLTNAKDSCRWTLEGSGEFSVSSTRKYIDDQTLAVVSSKTRWIKEVPIKVNILAWKVKINGLPTRLNLSKRGIDIDSILCPICEQHVESVSHTFFTCQLSREIFRKILRWWQIDVTDISCYEEWLHWLVNIRISSNHKKLLEGVCFVLWWHVWQFRNKSIFGPSRPLKAVLLDERFTDMVSEGPKSHGKVCVSITDLSPCDRVLMNGPSLDESFENEESIFTMMNKEEVTPVIAPEKDSNIATIYTPGNDLNLAAEFMIGVIMATLKKLFLLIMALSNKQRKPLDPLFWLMPRVRVSVQWELIQLAPWLTMFCTSIINLRVALILQLNARRLPLAQLVYFLVRTLGVISGTASMTTSCQYTIRFYYLEHPIPAHQLTSLVSKFLLEDLAAQLHGFKGHREDEQRETLSDCGEFHTCMLEEVNRLAPTFLKDEEGHIDNLELTGQPVGLNLAGLRGSRKLKPGALSLVPVGDGQSVQPFGSNWNFIYEPPYQLFLDNLKEHGIIAHRTPPTRHKNNGTCQSGEIETARTWYRSMLSLNHEEDDQEIDEPQSDINPIRRSTRTRRPTDRLCLYIDTEEHELGDLGEPANYKAALLDPESKKWLDAMNVEMQSMKDNDVWVLVELPPNARTVGSKWLFKKKTDMDGAVYIFKARLVARASLKPTGLIMKKPFLLLQTLEL